MSTDGLYIQLFSIHGLLRAENMELGRDADTGGQIKYVVELAEHLSQRKDVLKIDLFTRLISDKAVSSDYARPIEQVNDKLRIVRIQCGGRIYRRKELLWPHLDEYIDKTIKFIKRQGVLADVFHGHYPDAGYVAMQLAKIFGVPFIYTGHSMGRAKKQKLLGEGIAEADIDRQYKIDQRIYTEEDILKHADLIIASTNQEVQEQYGLYRNKDVPAFQVIPPGIAIDKFYPFYYDMLPENEKTEMAAYAQAHVLKELNRFFLQPDKPLILALSRPDKRKNISGLIKAFGRSLELQSMANLAIFAGLRKDIETMEENEKNVLTDMLLLMDKYDLYGKMAIPKSHDFEYEVPALYRIAAEKRGVFINPALTEPFGLTLLEAGASGLPIVATCNGGPQDIMLNCENGILVDPNNHRDIAEALKKIVSDPTLWERFSKSGTMNVRKHYTWESHAETYAGKLKQLVKEFGGEGLQVAKPSDPIGRRLTKLSYFLVTDIDNTLIGDDNQALSELIQFLQYNRDCIGFGVATGRPIDSALAILQEYEVLSPDIVISSVGTEIYYGRSNHYGKGWDAHLAYKWNRARIVELLAGFDFLKYQEDETQRKFKVSYYMAPGKDRLAAIHNCLLENKVRYNLVYSHGEFLDILPYRASKGKAIRYLSYKWEIPLRNFLVCGDSGNDEEMLRGEPAAVVVGNYSPELEGLKGARNVYFADAPCAGGIVEGIRKYQFDKKPLKEKAN